jgi:hypothetical protein
MSKVAASATKVHSDSGTEGLLETDVDPELARQQIGQSSGVQGLSATGPER